MGDIQEISNKMQFDEILAEAEDKLVVIYFYSSVGLACKKMDHAFEYYHSTFQDVLFCKVNGEEASDVTNSQLVSVFPTVLIYKKNTKVATMKTPSPDALKSKIRKLSMGVDSDSLDNDPGCCLAKCCEIL